MPIIADNGGSQILSYHLQRTETGGSKYYDVVGESGNENLNTEVQVEGLIKRKSYRFRYRVANLVGYSDWSPESFLTPAIRPSIPP